MCKFRCNISGFGTSRMRKRGNAAHSAAINRGRKIQGEFKRIRDGMQVVGRSRDKKPANNSLCEGHYELDTDEIFQISRWRFSTATDREVGIAEGRGDLTRLQDLWGGNRVLAGRLVSWDLILHWIMEVWGWREKNELEDIDWDSGSSGSGVRSNGRLWILNATLSRGGLLVFNQFGDWEYCFRRLFLRNKLNTRITCRLRGNKFLILKIKFF